MEKEEPQVSAVCISAERKERDMTQHDRLLRHLELCVCVYVCVFLKIRHREDVNMFLNYRVKTFLQSEDIHSHHYVLGSRQGMN